LIELENGKMTLIGNKTVRLFKKGEETKELGNDTDFTFLLNKN